MILFVAQNPGNNPKAKYYKNHTIDRLNKWCDELGITDFRFTNCVHEKGDVKLKDVDFDLLKSNTKDFDKVIALGAFASTCLNRINKSHFRLPHPSPRNRLMNDKQFIQQCLNECKEFLKGV